MSKLKLGYLLKIVHIKIGQFWLFKICTNNCFISRKISQLAIVLSKGQRNGKVILCLHGEPFWSQSYARLIPYLVRNGYRVIAPDFVGYGRSDKLLDWRAYSLGLHEALISQLIQQLELNHITLVGHNWGFLAGVHVLRKHPGWFDSLGKKIST